MRIPDIRSRRSRLRGKVADSLTIKPLVQRSRNNRMNAVAKRGKVFLAKVLRFDHIVQNHGECAGPQQPTRLLTESKCADHTHGYDGRAELQRHAEHTVLERAQAAIAGALPLR